MQQIAGVALESSAEAKLVPLSLSVAFGK